MSVSLLTLAYGETLKEVEPLAKARFSFIPRPAENQRNVQLAVNSDIAEGVTAC